VRISMCFYPPGFILLAAARIYPGRFIQLDNILGKISR
jgi:hypothetical protein